MSPSLIFFIEKNFFWKIWSIFEEEKGLLSKVGEKIPEPVKKVWGKVGRYIPYIGGAAGASAVFFKMQADQAAYASQGEEWPLHRRMMYSAQMLEEIASPFPITSNDVSDIADFINNPENIERLQEVRDRDILKDVTRSE